MPANPAAKSQKSRISPKVMVAALLIFFGFLVGDIIFMWRQNQVALQRISSLEVSLDAAQRRVEELENTDFAKKNIELTKELQETKAALTADLKEAATKYAADIKAIHDSFSKVATLYEKLIDLKEGAGKRSVMDKAYASVLRLLADQKIGEAEIALRDLETKIAQAESAAQAAGVTAAQAAALPTSNAAPGSGYSRQKVHIDAGDFIVSLVAADLNSAKVIVDTASDSTCTNNCPVLPLATYVSRSGAFAGINGVYFCPESYPSCAGKTNSFDQLIMNKNKVYFNSDNNVYSQNPVAIFGAGANVRFLGRAQDWGRDTGVDSVISNHPHLLLGGQVLASSGDPKLTARGYKGFISHIGNRAFMGFVHNATFNEAGQVLKAMGMEDAINLDSGGSTALWFGGYKLGPGRNLPMGILFVRR